MKKSTNIIMFLGIMAAMTLTGCEPTNINGSDAESSTLVEEDWSNKSFIGDYRGGMAVVKINADKTTSWGNSNDKHPAVYTDLGGGLYNIHSVSTVDHANYVDVVTDGTMAYVTYGNTIPAYYVMDKNALGSATIALSETEDREDFFGGIEVTAGHWKYLAYIGGTYSFDVTITMRAGTNINAGGAIFDCDTGTKTTYWKVVTATKTASSFATIIQTSPTFTNYTGEHGTLTIGSDGDGLVFATLNGTTLGNAILSADGNVLSVLNMNELVSYDPDNPNGPQKTVSATIYTLTKNSKTYVESNGTASIPLCDEIFGTSGEYQGETDKSGHVWVWYNATFSGKITIKEERLTFHASFGDSDVDYLAIYDTSLCKNTEYANTYRALKLERSKTGNAQLSNIIVEAGHHYIVKVGSSADDYKDWATTDSQYVCETIKLFWSFAPFNVETYTGDEGELTIEKDGTNIVFVKLNGQKLDNYTLDGNTLSISTRTFDMSDPNDPVYTTLTRIIHLYPNTKTYTITGTPQSSRPIHVLSETDTSYSGVTGNDGNIWCIFTPSKVGGITVIETTMGVSDSYLQIFEYDPNTGLAGLTSNGVKKLGYSDDNPATVTITVQAGVTYIIKLGAWTARNDIIGDVTNNSANIGCDEAFSFSYIDYLVQTFTGADGDLVIGTKDGECKMTTLAGTTIEEHAVYDEAAGTLTFYGAGTIDITTDPDNPTRSSTDTVFTLDMVNGTYTKSTPTNVRNIVGVLDESSTGYSQVTTEDGNIWASFSPTADGYINIDETTKCDDRTCLGVYDKLPTSTWDCYRDYSASSYGQISLAYNPVAPATSVSYTNASTFAYVHNLRVRAGHTYIIKLGTYGGDRVTIGGSVSAYYNDAVGTIEAFTFSYAVESVVTYTGDNGNLTLTLAGDEYLSGKIGTETIRNGTFSANGKALIDLHVSSVIDGSNRLDPIATYTNIFYYLDNETMTYVTDTELEEVHLFHVIQPTDTSFSGIVGDDGNLWGKFTAPDDGTITVEETISTSNDGFIAVYDSNAISFTPYFALETNDFNAALSGAGRISKLPVIAGQTYIIKAGNYYDRDKNIGAIGSHYAGKIEKVSFTYIHQEHDIYTGPEGDLDIGTFEGVYTGTTLNGEPFDATPNSDYTTYNSSISTLNTETLDVVTTTKTYTLGDGTYSVNTETESVNILADTWATINSGAYAACGNGAVIIKFVPTESRQYIFTASASTDIKFGLYTSDSLNETGFVSGTSLKAVDDGLDGISETFTYTCTAGATYYIKATAHFSEWSKPITALNSTRAGTEITISIA